MKHEYLKLRDERYIIFLKEQKYLLKHILMKQQYRLSPETIAKLVKLIKDYKDYYLVKQVDLDVYQIPDENIL